MQRGTPGPPATGGTPVRSVRSSREVVAYFLRLRPALGHAMQVRRPFVRQIGLLVEDLRRGDPITISRAAMSLGFETAPVFRELRLRFETLMPPPECRACNDAIVRWLDAHISAAGLLTEIGSRREPRRLREVQERLSEARAHAMRFNQEYTRLKAELRGRLEAARTRIAGRRRSGLLGWLRPGG
ncbi:MAG TPA: hypothetical protein VG370_33680 [Chloroflexota bacterium]|jgi:hypothetical protein|nr:hypothetical protein [Chloroflexota bacterium]